MELKDIVAVSGQSGLHKIIGRTKNGLILETIGSGKKFATGYQDRVSILEDISMYTQEGDMRLSEVLVKAHTAGKVPTAKDDAKVQRDFLIKTIGLDSERVYDSDIKKFFNWYNALKDVLDFTKLGQEPKTEEATATETGTDEATPAAEEKPKKAAAKKTAAKKVAAPKTTAAKTNSKGAGAAKTTYRPKSV
ncbi:MAG: DUF5606 domain-containing protein [Bacteroidota bacterium]